MRIHQKLFNETWLIKSSALKSMQTQFLDYQKGISALDNFEPEDIEKPQTQSGPIRTVSVNGALGLHLSLIENLCGNTDYYSIRSQLKQYRDDPTCETIVMFINSPGGQVTGCAESAQLIDSVAKVKPVYAYVDGMCCSAAYWLASQCTAIYCSESAEIGSIGCIMTHASYARQLEQEGVKTTTIKSNAFKDIGSPLRDMTDEEYNILLTDVKAIESQFIAAIQSKRNIDIAVLNGLTHDGNKAVELGFADSIENDCEEFIESLTKE